MKSGKNYVSTGAHAKEVGLALDGEINNLVFFREACLGPWRVWGRSSYRIYVFSHWILIWDRRRQYRKSLPGLTLKKCSFCKFFQKKNKPQNNNHWQISEVFVVIGPSWVYLKVLPFKSHLLFKIPHPALTQCIEWRRGWRAAHLPSRINGGDVRLPPPLTTSPFSAISGDSHAPIGNRLAVTGRPMATSETGLESIT